MADSVTIHAFVRAPYESYVHDETRFWNASGFSLKLGGTGVDVQVESLRAMLLGGVAFDTPEAQVDTRTSSEHHVFPLFEDQDAATAPPTQQSRWLPISRARFRGSVPDPRSPTRS